MHKGQQQPCRLVGWSTTRLVARSGPLLTNRMTESVTYGSVGGGGSNPAPYPAADPASPSSLHIVTVARGRCCGALGHSTHYDI